MFGRLDSPPQGVDESGYSNEVCYTVSTGSGDTDGDGASDADERDIYGTDPRKADTDGYGLGDGDEVAFWRRPWHEDDDGDGVVNLLDEDADGDGLLDGYDSTPGSGIVLPSRKRSMPVGQPILHTMGFATKGDRLFTGGRTYGTTAAIAGTPDDPLLQKVA
jgi:hypothetical protein